MAMDGSDTIYRVGQARGPVVPGAGWDSEAWRGIPPLTIRRHMGEPPAHRPLAQAKLQYDCEALHVAFRVEDRWVIGRVKDYQGDVCTDSCVEFFFTPGTDLAQGYFNLEASCVGTLLFTHRQSRDEAVIDVPERDARRLDVAHTLPSRIEKEIQNPRTWEVSYRIPVELLRAHAPVVPPAPGVLWRANFYKCADASSHPHWLTWAPVDWPHPDFHRKEFFGTLAFE
jgi:hypothetical protein